MNYKHGQSGTRVYAIWCAMKQRCCSPNNRAYPSYGGRGIKVCDRWMDFANFLDDMGQSPEGHSIERKDNDKGYCPTNCIWATRKTQNRNKRDNVLITIGGETHPLAVWAERSGLKYQTVHMRLRKGWSPENAVNTPLVTRRLGIPSGQRIHDFDADVMVSTSDGNIPLWKAIEASGLKPQTVHQRIKRGWSPEAAVSLSPRKGPRKEAFGAEHDVKFNKDRKDAA